MEKRSRNLIIGLLAAVLAAALVWGVVENVQRRAYRLRLNAMLERSFYELVSSLGDMEVKLDKLTVSDGAGEDVLLLSELYRQADGAARDVAALPGGHESIEEVLAFVNRLSEYSGALMRRVAQGGGITAAEEAQLGVLLERCRALNRTVQSLEVSQVAQVSLTDVRSRTGAASDPYAAFANPTAPVPQLIYDGAFSQASRTPPRALGVERIDEQAALAIARRYVGEGRVTAVEAEQGVDGEIPCWGVRVDTADAGALHLQITRTGGHVLLMMPEYSPGGVNHTLDACRRNAEEFLRTRQYGDVEPAYYQVGFGMVTFNFVPVQSGVRLYPDLVKVQVSLETGLVIGVESNNYLRNHVPRAFPENPLTADEARALVHTLEVESVRPVLIPRNGQEIFCYEVRGTHEGQTYLVYLDAVTGRTQDILQVVRTDDGEQVL